MEWSLGALVNKRQKLLNSSSGAASVHGALHWHGQTECWTNCSPERRLTGVSAAYKDVHLKLYLYTHLKKICTTTNPQAASRKKKVCNEI